MSFASSLSVQEYAAQQFQSIEAYTIQLEQIPLEEFRTSAEARATFLTILKAASNDFEWIVEEIGMSQDSIADIKYLKLDAEKFPHYEEFITTGKAVIARFAACFPAIKNIVLDESHEEIDELALELFHLPYAEKVEEALQADLTPRACFV
jgi:hypothetical protein